MRQDDADTLTAAERRELDALDAALAGREVDPELAELAELAAALRDERPELDDEAVGRLNLRAAALERGGRLEAIAGERLASAWRRLRAVPLHRALLPAGAAATLIVAVAVGISQTGGDDPPPVGEQPAINDLRPFEDGGAAYLPSEAPAAREDASRVERDANRGAALGSADRRAVSPIAVSPIVDNLGGGALRNRDNRKEDRDAAMTLSTEPDEVRRVATEVVAVTRRFDGIVASSQVVEDQTRGASASLQLRIPTARLDDAITALTELASVESLSESVQDITKPFVTAREKLADARAERERLLERLAEATDAAEIESLNQQLRRARNRIANARADFQRVAQRANLADVNVGVVGNGEGSDGSWGLDDAADDAVSVLRAIGGATIVALAVILPLAAVLAIVWLGTSAWSRRRRERALDADR